MIYTPPKNFLLTQAKKSFLYWKKRFYIYILRHSMISKSQKKIYPQKAFWCVLFMPYTIEYAKDLDSATDWENNWQCFETFVYCDLSVIKVFLVRFQIM